MSGNTDNFHQKSFRIKHNDEKFITRLLSKESSKSDPSFRVYYGDAPSAVPFTWETAPGTPKHKSCDDYVPPLTPPPSYYTNNLNKCSKKHSTSKILLHTLLRRMMIPKKVHLAKSRSPSSSSSLSSQSWSSSDQSLHSDRTMTKAYVHRPRWFSSWGSSFDESGTNNYGRDKVILSRLCFGIGKDDVRDRIKGGCSVVIVKKALLSIVGVGRGSAA